MSLRTLSAFYYGHTIDFSNFALDFSEGGPELQADIDPGSYSLQDFADAVSNALNTAGALEYTVTVDRETRKLTIEADGDFELLVSTGTRVDTGAWVLMGFTGADRTGADSYEGDTASGEAYYPQFILQDHLGKDKNVKAIDPVVNKSAAGVTEVVRFGTERMISFNVKYITNVTMPDNGPITNNPTGVEDALAFLEHAVQKKPFEYMPNKDVPDTYDRVILETTPKSSNGTDYELKELYDSNLPDFFETGKMTMRVLE